MEAGTKVCCPVTTLFIETGRQFKTLYSTLDGSR
jgi:hypothetical protein